MDINALIEPIIAGLVVAVPTVASIKTDVGWLKKEMQRLDDAIVRAHERIDKIEKARN